MKKTGEEIYLMGLDVIEANRKANYDDKTTQERKSFNNEKWISIKDIANAINNTKVDSCFLNHKITDAIFETLEIEQREEK